MKLTVDIPEQLIDEAKVSARNRGLTFREWVMLAFQKEIGGAVFMRPTQPGEVEKELDNHMREVGGLLGVGIPKSKPIKDSK